MRLLGTVFWNRAKRVSICWRSRGWWLTFALLCMALSLQVGLSRADNSTVIGGCVNGLCLPSELCCSPDNYCGADARYCGPGCQSGPCYSKKKGLSGGAIAGIVLGVLLLAIFAALAVAWQWWKSNKRVRTIDSLDLDDVNLRDLSNIPRQISDGAEYGRLSGSEMLSRHINGNAQNGSMEMSNVSSRQIIDSAENAPMEMSNIPSIQVNDSVENGRKEMSNRRSRMDNIGQNGQEITKMIPRPCQKFTVDQLRLATGGFSNDIGQGGFGIVYKGTLEDGRKVAIKKLKQNQRLVMDFLAEVQTLGRINHANLVELLGYAHQPAAAGQDEQELYLVYEFVAKKSLDQWIFESKKDSTLPWDTRINIIKGMAKGLEYLHEHLQGGKRITHLDIKPHNILLNNKNVPKIADFGMAKWLGSESTGQPTRALAGTPGYMAPEQLDMPADPKMDVYSFGMVLLEVISGRHYADRSEAPDRVYLPLWAFRKLMEGKQLEVVDPKIRDGLQIDANSAGTVIRIGLSCLHGDPGMRPKMSEVLSRMEKMNPPSLHESLKSDLENRESHYRPRLWPQAMTPAGNQPGNLENMDPPPLQPESLDSALENSERLYHPRGFRPHPMMQPGNLPRILERKDVPLLPRSSILSAPVDGQGRKSKLNRQAYSSPP
ncbi:unnamed protein product [Calypogeia fissa]